ncbi:MAG: multidrug efflux pump subunit AcrB [Candidatus Paceibacteria bacterium]|jgi:multidrug efflux pump subunit AcrB
MNISRFAMTHKPLVLAVAFAAFLSGIMTFKNMPRREDPAILIRNCIIETRWPGASAEKVEELVTDILEEAVTSIDEVYEVNSRSRTGVSTLNVELDELVTEVDQAWDEIRAKVEQVSARLPVGCGTSFVNSDFGDVAAVCVMLYQTPPEGGFTTSSEYTYRELEQIADIVRDDLKGLESVATVTITGIQEEQIFLEVDAGDWAKMDLTRQQLADLFQQRNILSPGGQIESEGSRYTVRPSGEFQTVAEMNALVVGRNGDTLPIEIGEVPATLSREYVQPAQSKVRFVDSGFAADRCLLLAITMKGGRNVVEMGKQVDATIARLQATSLPPDIEFATVNNLPRQVDNLIKDFITNLWQAIVIVLLVAFLMMGWRPALIMAAAIPLCMVATFPVVSALGVELEQFSIASLIIALGMVVDNAIVVSDNTLALMRQGKGRVEAAIEGAHGLAIPILTSTLTTVAAFAPMLTIPGSSGEYMASLPIVVSITLLISWVVAMTVTPLFCAMILKVPEGSGDSEPEDPALTGIGKVYDKVIRWCMGHQLLTLGSAATAVILSLQLAPLIGMQFFPAGYRDQFFVHVWMPEGTPMAETDRVCAEVEERLLDSRMRDVDGVQKDMLASAVSYVGMGGPRMMLTMAPEDSVPHYALLVVNTTEPSLSGIWADELNVLCADIPGARVDVRRYMLGPPIKNPIEFRLTGSDASILREAAVEMQAICRAVAGASDPVHDWGNSGLELAVEIQEEAANLASVSNASIAETLNDLLSGGYLTTLHEGDHSINVMLRLRKDQRSGPEDLSGLFVNGKSGKVPLSSVATIETAWQPELIRRVNNRRTISVSCAVEQGFLSTRVAAEIQEGLEEFVATMPPGYFLDVRGEAYESAKGSENIGGAMQISMLLILLVLVSQYNSLLKPFIVLMAVPLALIGALIGLYVTGWALGFMPMLGIVALAGVVINNAIILIDFIEEGVGNGKPLREAVARAGNARMKPIVLTTLTTVGGLLPLAIFGGPMWAGMSYAMIVGLVLSTALTLLVIPTAYVTFAERLGMRVLPATFDA